MGAVVVIPVYKKEMTEAELASLKQCVKILGKHPIEFICPESLDTATYEKILSDVKLSFEIVRFEDKYFKSVKSYSKLLLNSEFYSYFEDYKYMLIYQLDAWVFKDELEYWCEQNYDYIGAPWFEGYNTDGDVPLMNIAGNGGFSLRNISKVKSLLSLNFKEFPTMDEIYYFNKKNRPLSNILNMPSFLIKWLIPRITRPVFWQSTQKYEDCVIAEYGPKLIKDFLTAPPEVAMRFSFEIKPKKLYEITGEKLPFGCHGFEKNSVDFWKKFIEI